jgi:hypothetical protein
MSTSYQRNVEQLRAVASMFWPSEVSREEAEMSVIPVLLQTQDQFIAILSVQVANIEGFFGVLTAATLPISLFLKHLVVLADFGGEMLQRVNREFHGLFPEGRLEYIWNGNTHLYYFQNLPINNLDNNRLGISGRRLAEEREFTTLDQDVIALLLLGSAATDENVANILSKCEISEYLGQPDKLDKLIKQRYIWVSRITGGSQSNNLGQIAQRYVAQYLQENLGILNVDIAMNGHLPGVTHTEEKDNRLTTFDIVLSKANSQFVAVEISFQVTTNSVIERKSGQAQSRFQQIERLGHKIAYVIDGAGNFQRETALRTICTHSHCTVAFSPSELDVLCDYIRENIS